MSPQCFSASPHQAIICAVAVFVLEMFEKWPKMKKRN